MRGSPIAYSADEIAWLSDNRHLPAPQYHRGFCARFERDVSAANLAAKRKRHGWTTGRTGRFEKGATPHNQGKPCRPGTGGLHPNAMRTQFKKGALPRTTKHAGHERVTKDGYTMISVEERNPHTGFERRYVLKHRWLWEQQNGPVPEGMALKRLGDKANTDPSNWVLVPRGLLPRLNGRSRRDFDGAPAELKPTILTVARLEHSARTRSKEAA